MKIEKLKLILKNNGFSKDEIYYILNIMALEKGRFSPLHALGYSNIYYKLNELKENKSEIIKNIHDKIL